MQPMFILIIRLQSNRFLQTALTGNYNGDTVYILCGTNRFSKCHTHKFLGQGLKERTFVNEITVVCVCVCVS